MRGILGFIGLFTAFYSFTVLPIAVAMMIIGTTPLFVMLFGSLVLKETIRLGTFILGLGVVLSIFFVVRTGDTDLSDYRNMSIIGIAVAFISSIAAALAFTTVRAVVQEVGVQAVVFWFAGICLIGSVIIGGIPTYIVNVPPHILAFLTSLCLLGVVSDLAKTKAYKHGAAWFVSLLAVSTVAVSGLLAWLFLDQTLLWTQWVGIIIMMILMGAVIYQARA